VFIFTLSLLPAESPGTHSIGDWVGPRIGMENTEKITRTRLLGRPSLSLNIPTELTRIASYTLCALIQGVSKRALQLRELI
jgi:hypothetical protein